MNKIENVGSVITKVQDQLSNLKQQLERNCDTDGKIDVEILRNAFVKAEEEVRERAEGALRQLNNQITAVPSLEEQIAEQFHRQNASMINSAIWGMRQDSQGQMQVRRTGSLGFLESRGGDTQGRSVPFEGPELVQVRDIAGPSPGQQSAQALALRIMSQPYNPLNRRLMQEKYGIQLPQIHDKRTTRVVLDQNVAKGSNVERLAALPHANRVDPQLMPPAISETDARKGIISLLERGLIPPAAEITLIPPPVHHRAAPIYDSESRYRDRFPADAAEPGFNTAGYRLDPSVITTTNKYNPQMLSKRMPAAIREFQIPLEVLEDKLEERVNSATKNTDRQQLAPPPTTPASRVSKTESTHRFSIQNGKTRQESKDFIAFKQHYCLSWGSIVTVLSLMEKFLQKYSIPIAFIHGDRLADLSIEYEMEQVPTEKELLNCLVNREDIEKLIRKPGRQFMGPKGVERAVTKIQAIWRGYAARRAYLIYRQKKWAAGVIAIQWILHMKMTNVKKQLKVTRLKQVENFRRRYKQLGEQWNSLITKRRVIIHLPSLGLPQKMREKIHDFPQMQNRQMSRLCDLQDPLVDVIYVSPVPINDELLQYYSKLTGLKSAIDSGDVTNQRPISERYKIIVPEAINSFPTHKMCLSTLLKYSPRAMRRIRNLTRGRVTIIVPALPNYDDIEVAERLDATLLCSEPEISHLYNTKSGSKRIFASAQVPIPMSEYDVYSLDQLHECLSQLITENVDVQRWLFKLDTEIDGRGIAYVDVKHMPCYAWVLKERQRYGEKWNKKWAQESASRRILEEIPELLRKHARPAQPEIYSSWQRFCEAFLSQGGVVEATPPSDSFTNITVDMFLAPDGQMRIISSSDQFHGESPLTAWGYSVPQSSVEPSELNKLCERISVACQQRRIGGYFSVDFVTFLERNSEKQIIWATDISMGLSDSASLVQLVLFATAGQFNQVEHVLNSSPSPLLPTNTLGQKKPRVKEEDTQRFAVISSQLIHSNMSVVHYSVFFQTCRAHGIGYDVSERQGTLFTLMDSFDREKFCMVTVADSLEKAFTQFASNLNVIHQEISTSQMQGQTNFKAAINDIEDILGQALDNLHTED